jgi:hypothetical protein
MKKPLRAYWSSRLKERGRTLIQGNLAENSQILGEI